MTDLNVLASLGSWEWPDDARDSLLEAVRNRELDEEDRALAAELAGDLVVMDDEVAAALLSVLRTGEEPASVRAGAAISFGPVLELAEMEEFEDPEEVPITESVYDEIRETLRNVYRDESAPKEVRRRALEASVRASEDWHRDAVRSAFAGDDRDWRLTAVFCMCYVPGFETEILEALDSDDENTEYQAVCAAGAAGLDAAWPHVADVLARRRGDRPLLLAAIESAAAIRPEEAQAVLVDLAREMDEEEIDDAVGEAVAFAEAMQELMLLDEED